MKYTNLRAFDKHLAEAAPNHFAEVYLVLAKDSFVRKQAADRVVGAFPDALPQTFDAASTPIETIIEELSSLTFFSKKRTIFIQNLDKAAKPFLDKLEVFLPAVKSTFLVLSGSSLSAATKLYKRIEKMGIVFEQPEEKPWEKEKSAQEWIISRASQLSKTISSQAALFLVKQVGADPAVLFQEMEKLFCYIDERKEISQQDIMAISGSANLDTAWQLGEAIFRRDATSALRISKGLLDDGTAFLALLRQLRSQFETECQICCILNQGGSSAEVNQQFPYMKGAILERHLQQAKGYGLQNLKEGILKIDACELKAKNSGIDQEILNELLIVHLTK